MVVYARGAASGAYSFQVSALDPRDNKVHCSNFP